MYEDLGSGCIVDLKPFGIEEPVVADSIRAGVDVVSFSGDKLLGGPQAGIITGKPDLVARIRRNPLFRAFRAGKLVYQQLEATLRCLLFGRWDEIPALSMVTRQPESIRIRAERIRGRMPGWDVEVRPGAICHRRRLDSGAGAADLGARDLRSPALKSSNRELRSGTPAVVCKDRGRPPYLGSTYSLRGRGRGARRSVGSGPFEIAAVARC